MPFIPDLTPVSGNWQQAAPNPSVAAAPGQAVADVGRAVIGAADDVTAIGMKVKRVREADAMNRARMEFAKARANHSEFRMRNPDQTKWEGHLQSEIAAARERLGNPDVGPSARQAIDTEWQTWAANETSQTRLDSVKFEMTRARQNVTNLQETYMRAGDFESARRVAREAGPLFTPEDVEAMDLDIGAEEKTWSERAAEKADMDAIDADPIGKVRELEANPPAADADDATKARHNRMLDRAKRQKSSIENEFVDSVRDGMAAGPNGEPAKILTPDQIDALGPDVSPRVREILKGELLDRSDAERQAAIRRPEYQQQLVGTVAGMLENIDPNDSEQLTQATSLLNEMQPGPVKSHYASELAAKLRGEPAGDDWILDHGLSVVKELETAGVFGKIPGAEKFQTERAIANGAVNSLPNLKAIGFDDAQAAAIIGAKDSKDAATPKARLDKFRELWTARGEPAKDADPFVVATMTAIGEGASSYTVEDPKGADAALLATWNVRAKSGAARAEFIRWRKVHPKATEAEARAEAVRLGGATAETAWDSVIDDPLDGGPGVLPPRDTPYTGPEFSDPNDPIIDLPPP